MIADQTPARIQINEQTPNASFFTNKIALWGESGVKFYFFYALLFPSA